MSGGYVPYPEIRPDVYAAMGGDVAGNNEPETFNQAAKFVRSLLPDGEGYVTIAGKLPEDQPDDMHQTHVPADDVDAIATAIRQHHEYGRNVWFNAALHGERARRKNTVKSVQSAWTDLDYHVADELRAELTSAGFGLVESGSPGKAHTWVKLSEPVDAEESERLNKALCAALGGDPKPTGAQALMRVPGTVNRKPGAGEVRLVAEPSVWTPEKVTAWAAQRSSVTTVTELLADQFGESKGAAINAAGDLDDDLGWDYSAYCLAAHLLVNMPAADARARYDHIIATAMARDITPEKAFTKARAEGRWQSAMTWATKEGKLYVAPAPEGTDAHRNEVAEAAHRLRVQEEARRIVHHETVLASWVGVGEIIRADALLMQPDEEEPFLIDKLWHRSGNVLCAAEAKAGKTVVAHNAIRSILDGVPFLGRWETLKTDRAVVLVNVELTTNQVRSWLRQQGIANVDRLHVWNLRGQTSRFAIHVPEIRAKIAAELKAIDCGTLVIDPVGPIWDSFGIDENGNTEVGEWLQHLDALKHEGGVDQGFCVVHAGHGSNGRARGASKQLGWGDSLWQLTKEGEDDVPPYDGLGFGEAKYAPRFFRAEGRDVFVPKTQLSFDDEHKHLTALSRHEVQEHKRDAEAEMVARIVTAQPGIAAVELREKMHCSNDNKTGAIQRAVTAGMIVLEQDGRAKHYRPATP